MGLALNLYAAVLSKYLVVCCLSDADDCNYEMVRTL